MVARERRIGRKRRWSLSSHVAWRTTILFGTAIGGGCGQANVYVEPPPPEVTTAAPVPRAVTSYLEYTGTTRAVERVDLRARVRGFLKQKLFKAGAEVKAGQLLMVIEEEPFQVALDQAKAKRDEAQATLKKAEQSKARQVAQAKLDVDIAQLLLARIDEGRNKALLSRNAGTREDLDKSDANRKRYDAEVESDRANLEQSQADYEINILAARSSLTGAQAEVRNAEINLGYCRITSPIDGRIAVSDYDVGNYVGDGQATNLATVVKTNPVFVYANISEDDLLRVRRMLLKEKRPGSRDEVAPMEMGLGDEVAYPHTGRLDYADPSVDIGTGTVRVRGVFENPDGMIAPGLFVRIRLPFERREDALMVPDRALGADQAGPYLLVVGKDDLVERRAVRPGTEIDGMRVVDGKIAVGDRVVVEGLQRARPGLKVVPKPVAPATVKQVVAADAATGPTGTIKAN